MYLSHSGCANHFATVLAKLSSRGIQKSQLSFKTNKVLELQQQPENTQQESPKGWKSEGK